MDVLALLEDPLQDILVGDVRKDPQLDLRVVGRDQLRAGLGDEAAADLAAELCADRDVLEIRIRARQPAGGRRSLVEGRVESARLGGDQSRERVEVGALQLRQLPPGLDLSDDLVLVADRRQHAGVRREAGLAPALLAQAELVEEDPAELLGRADGELLAGELVDLALEPRDVLRNALRKPAEPLDVELDSLALEPAQHLDERQLDFLEEAP